jgi:hypothetical protein
MPQPPQLAASLPRVAVSQPLLASPSQSPKPLAHAPTTHADPEHAFTATFESEQALVHEPQWLTSVVSFTQAPVQFVRPLPQVVVHTPLEHTVPPGHTLPHDPQLPPLARTLTSQPFAGLPSQSAKPGLQVPIAHVPAAQLALAFGNEHVMPHPPQSFTSLPRVAVSQPSAGLPLQSPQPLAHAPTTHAPAEHAFTVTCGSAHAPAQLPQWLTSVCSFTQLPEQLVSPAPHVVVHVPLEHTVPPGHTLPHEPQLPLFARTLISQPFAGLPSQSAKPGLQVPIAHVPAAHVALAFGNEHVMPQPPQLLASLARVAVSQPSAALPLQSP